MKATLLKTDGKREIITPKNGRSFVLEELQNLVGGYIEVINIGKQIMVINEEGRIERLHVNRAASGIAGFEIVGDVLIGNRDIVR